MSDFFVMKLCKGAVAFNVTPKKTHKINLTMLKDSFSVSIQTPLLAVANINGTEVSIYKTGKLLIRTTDKTKAERIAHKVYDVIGVIS